MIPSLIYLDRYRNEGTRDYSPHAAYTEADDRYRPDSGIDAIGIPSFNIPTRELNLYYADPEPGLRDLYIQGDHACFCVHPQVLDPDGNDPYLRKIQSFDDHRLEISASPSSSTRTVYVHGRQPPHALKLHFPFRVSRYGRRMRDEVVQQALSVSSELQKGISVMGSDFCFLREVLGVTLKNLDPDAPRGESWGYLVRELLPFPHTPDERSLVPGFALYGKDFFEPESPPLLFELAADRDARDYVLEEIMLPIIRHWAACFLNFGLALEPHGQNVLLEIGPEGNVTRIVYRDLNLGVDVRRRRDLQIPIDPSNTYNHMESGDFNSITYDKFMGGHFFDHLVAVLGERYPGVDPEEFRQPSREEFARFFPDHEEYLPRTVRYFSEERDRFGKPLFQDTGEDPDWRP